MQPLPATTPVSVASGAIFDLTGVSQTIASLSGAGRVTNSVAQAVTLTLSNNTGTATFSGNITDQAASNSVSLIQSGAGTNIFSGANTYRGTTTIRGGLFLVNGSLGTNAVTVATGGILGGSGTIGGALANQSGGTLAPGGGLTTLTVNNKVTLQSGGTTLMEISKTPLTNDQLRVTGALNCGGTLTVTNIGATPFGAGDTFQIFSAASYSGAFGSITLPALTGNLIWTNRLTVDGTLAVVNPVSTVPTNLVWSMSGTNLNLLWPSDHTGWRLLVQTNNLAGGISSNTNDGARSRIRNRRTKLFCRLTRHCRRIFTG